MNARGVPAAQMAGDPRRVQPEDQADGLRRLFSARTVRFIPVVANPGVAQEAALIRQICTALEQLGLYTLQVDVRDTAGVPGLPEPSGLADRVQVLSDRTARLTAPARTALSGGRSLLQAALDAAPRSQAVVVHGEAADLVHLFGAGPPPLSQPRPIVLCDEQSAAVTQAYAALKCLSLQARWMAYDLLFSTASGSPHAQRVQDRLAQAASTFLGCVRHDAIHLDPRTPLPAATATPVSASLMAFMEASMEAASAFVLPDPRNPGHPGHPGPLPAPVTGSPLLQSMV